MFCFVFAFALVRALDDMDDLPMAPNANVTVCNVVIISYESKLTAHKKKSLYLSCLSL